MCVCVCELRACYFKCTSSCKLPPKPFKTSGIVHSQALQHYYFLPMWLWACPRASQSLFSHLKIGNSIVSYLFHRGITLICVWALFQSSVSVQTHPETREGPQVSQGNTREEALGPSWLQDHHMLLPLFSIIYEMPTVHISGWGQTEKTLYIHEAYILLEGGKFKRKKK